MSVASKKIAAELRAIAAAHGGMIKPEYVVKAATPKTSPLHGCFDWNDTEAARLWRLEQARGLIQVTVELIGPPDNQEPSRVFVSLSSDRGAKRGYRLACDVLSDRDMSRQLLEDAKADMESFTKRYARLRELARVIREMKKIR